MPKKISTPLIVTLLEIERKNNIPTFLSDKANNFRSYVNLFMRNKNHLFTIHEYAKLFYDRGEEISSIELIVRTNTATLIIDLVPFGKYRLIDLIKSYLIVGFKCQIEVNKKYKFELK